MTSTPIYALTEWGSAQASPWIPHNQAIRALEAAARGSVLDRDLTAPPVSCDDGACYLIDTVATGLWATHDGQMAVAVGEDASNGWLFLTIATEGQFLWVEDEAIRIQYASGVWSTVSLGTSTPVYNELPTGTIDGANATFTLANEPSGAGIQLYLNGVRQQPGMGKDYTLASDTITMTVAPSSDDILMADYQY